MSDIQAAIQVLKTGGIIAYPTEAVYGLGCDPFNESAVMKVYQIKQRSMNKGLIIIASDFSQISDLIIPTEHMSMIMQTWPGPNTWAFPVTKKVPAWLMGEFDSLAVRVIDHPIAKKLCEDFGMPIVSTSANLSSEMPVTTWQALDPRIIQGTDYLVQGSVGTQEKCSVMRDARTLEVLRA